MQTRVICLGDRFCNLFTKSGRQQNSIYKNMRQQGMDYIRERRFPDNSRVVLGYKSETEKLANIACLIKPDFSTELKTSNRVKGFNNYLIIGKVWKNPEGEEIKQKVTGIIFSDKDKHIAGKIQNYTDESHPNLIMKYDIMQFSYPSETRNEKVYKVQSKLNSDYYMLTQHSDGSREYEKSINGEKSVFRAE